MIGIARLEVTFQELHDKAFVKSIRVTGINFRAIEINGAAISRSVLWPDYGLDGPRL